MESTSSSIEMPVITPETENNSQLMILEDYNITYPGDLLPVEILPICNHGCCAMTTIRNLFCPEITAGFTNDPTSSGLSTQNSTVPADSGFQEFSGSQNRTCRSGCEDVFSEVPKKEKGNEKLPETKNIVPPLKIEPEKTINPPIKIKIKDTRKSIQSQRMFKCPFGINCKSFQRQSHQRSFDPSFTLIKSPKTYRGKTNFDNHLACCLNIKPHKCPFDNCFHSERIRDRLKTHIIKQHQKEENISIENGQKLTDDNQKYFDICMPVNELSELHKEYFGYDQFVIDSEFWKEYPEGFNFDEERIKEIYHKFI